MRPKCIYGNHGAVYGECLDAPNNGMPCEPEPPSRDPNAPMDPADLASLLEREPHQSSGYVLELERRLAKEIKRANLAEARATVASVGLATAGERIQALEGVLETVQRKANAARIDSRGSWPADMNVRNSALSDIARLVTETLHPHQPWCRDESHAGACISDPEERDDGE